MGKLRVGVVDDSAFMRMAIRRIVEADPRFAIVWEASDGAQAIANVQRARPDVVTIDLNMPGETGDRVVRRLLEIAPIPIVLLSAHTSEGARATIDALSAGAVEVVAKPTGEVSFDLAKLAPELLTKLVVAAGARVSPPRNSTIPTPAVGAPSVPNLRASSTSVSGRIGSSDRVSWVPPSRASLIPTPMTQFASKVIVIGASAGGPAALTTLFARLRTLPETGLIVVQHLATSALTQALAARLDGSNGWKVREATDGDRAQVGVVLVAPGDRHLSLIAAGAVRLTQDAPLHGVRPSIDVAMRACAVNFGARCTGVLLTGMGRDGAAGMAAIRSAGGRTIAQDQASSVVYGIARAAVEVGAVEEVCPLATMADVIGRVRSY